MVCAECGGEHASGLCSTYAKIDTPPPGAARPTREHRVPLGEGDRLKSFWLNKKLGSGTTAEVFLAENEVTQARQAVKVLRDSMHADAEIMRRFESEARTTDLVRHEHVVEIHDIGIHSGWQHYIFLELLEGPTLGAMLQQRLDPATAGRIALQLCSALSAAHAKGVVHRDLKPANVFVLQRNGGPHAKLVDFGMARRQKLNDGEERTRYGTIVGTALYMSPEQARGGEIDGRSDIYSLGVMLFQMATGKLPFTADHPIEVILAHTNQPPPPPRSIDPSISASMEAVILRCLAKKPEERWPTMDELGRALAASLQGDHIAAPVVRSGGPTIQAQFASAPRPQVPLGESPAPSGSRPALGKAPVPPSGNKKALGAAPVPPTGSRAAAGAATIPGLPPGVPPPKGAPLPPPIPGPPATATPSGPVARRQPRIPTSFGVQVHFGGELFGDALVTDISIGGAFVRTNLSLPLFSRVRLVGSTTVGTIDATGEVVRLSQQVDRPGFGLRFEVLPDAQRGVLEALCRAKTGEAASEGDSHAEAQLRQFESRQGNALYEQLGVARDAPTRRIRDVCARLAEELAPHNFPALTPGQRTRLEALRLRVAEAEEVLIDPRPRALYDAINGNVLGVLRCITEGLSLEDVGALRTDFLKVRPDAETRARPAVERAAMAEGNGDFGEALQAIADALCDDPLNLDLHHRAVELRGLMRIGAA